MSKFSSWNVRYPRYQDTDLLQLCGYVWDSQWWDAYTYRTSMVPEQELQSSCLIHWIGDHPREADYPKDGDHPRLVVVEGMATVREGDNHGDRDFCRNGNSYGMVTILRMVTVQGTVTVPGMVNIIAMVGAADWTPYIGNIHILSSYLKFGKGKETVPCIKLLSN